MSFQQQSFGTSHAFNGGGMQYNTNQQQGGGFMQAGPADSSSQNQGGQRKPASAKALVPCSIHQLKEVATKNDADEGFVLDGAPVAQVTIIGRILSSEPKQNYISYQVDDGTGDIEVRQWQEKFDNMEVEGGAAVEGEFREGMYIRSIGVLRDFKENRYLYAFKLIPVTDFNEITFHNLNIIASHINIRKANAAPQAMGGQAGGQPAPTGYGSAFKAEPLTAGGAGALQGYGDLEQRVLNFVMRAPPSDMGPSVAEISQHLSNVDRASLMKAINSLCEEGQMYSTIDEEHFKYSAA